MSSTDAVGYFRKWLVAMKTLLFSLMCLLSFTACLPTDFKPSVDINEGDPYPSDGPIVIRVHLRLGGAPGDRCDAMMGSYQPANRVCVVVYPGE